MRSWIRRTPRRAIAPRCCSSTSGATPPRRFALPTRCSRRTPAPPSAFLIRGTVARLAGDPRMLARAYDGFLAGWEAEIKAARPEYAAHRTMLDQFHAAALEGRRKGAKAQ